MAEALRLDTETRAMLSRGELYRRAMKARQLAQIAEECAGSRVCDLARVERLLAEIGAIVGGVRGDD